MKIPAIRAHLKKAATREPALQKVIGVLRKQLGNYQRGNTDDRKALKPEILKIVANVEKATCGR